MTSGDPVLYTLLETSLNAERRGEVKKDVESVKGDDEWGCTVTDMKD